MSEVLEKEVTTRRDVTNMYAALNKVKDLRGLKFAYAVKKNKDKLMGIVKPVIAMEETMRQPDDKYTEYCNLGSAINGNRDLTKEEKDVQTEELNKKFKKTVERTANMNKEYNDIMGEAIEEEINYHKVDMEFIPEDITAQMLDDLEFMINDL